jgi:hypothetical protein
MASKIIITIIVGYAAVARSIKIIHLKGIVLINNVKRNISYLTENKVRITKTNHTMTFTEVIGCLL